MTYRKKLIEVSLPLEAINEESAREKSIRHGHPSSLHLWWARRPLAACRAVLWATLVDDPSEYMPDDESANKERDRLFAILEKLVQWENISNEEVLDSAKLEIARSVARALGCNMPVGKEAIREFLSTKVPPVLDPFAGGGSIPLEAQRLGLCANASDLNPVALLINKALIEIPPKFSGTPPVHPPEEGQRQDSLLKKDWKGSEGLAEDVRYYGKWMRDKAENLVGNVYPKANITSTLLADRPDLQHLGLKPGDNLNVIAWLWARTVMCPNPACGMETPLFKSATLSTKKHIWVQPICNDNSEKKVTFKVNVGGQCLTEGSVNRNGAFCVICHTPISFDYIREQGRAKKFSSTLMAIVADTGRSRVYLPTISEHEKAAFQALPTWIPESELPDRGLGISLPIYGFNKHSDLFTERQLLLLSTVNGLTNDAKTRIVEDCKSSFVSNPEEYANAVITYLGLASSKLADYNSSLSVWSPTRDQAKATFTRQALPIIWDFAEVNPFAHAAGDLLVSLKGITEALEDLPGGTVGKVEQRSATSLISNEKLIISTDPPYYDNIGYADLSDYFYTWIRKSLSGIYPELCATLVTPKSDELVANPYRFGGDRQKAQNYFENGLGQFFERASKTVDMAYPMTVFYAFKQTEVDGDDDGDDSDLPEAEKLTQNIKMRASTGWETMLEGLLHNGFQITGTWPMRTERNSRTRSIGSNALASSIVLVCRPRSEESTFITRRELLSFFKKELPVSLHKLKQGNIAPVDLAQAAIGPGMAIFSRYKTVLEADGSPMRVRAALVLINQALDEYLAEQEGEYDSDTRWALAWFEQYGNEQGPYGVAETLSKAKNTSVEGLSHAGFLEARAGKVRLLKRDELDDDWDPNKDKRLTAWETAQYLIRTLDKEGEKGAGALLGKLGSFGEMARDLAYRLYTICERKGWAQEALAYNMLVVAWPRIKEQSGKGPRQESLL